VPTSPLEIFPRQLNDFGQCTHTSTTIKTCNHLTKNDDGLNDANDLQKSNSC